MHEKPSIPDEHLRACLREHYDLSVATVDFLPLGMDTRSAVYRVASAPGAMYLLKARVGAFYEPSCYVPRYLRDQGIATVIAPLPTTEQTLWAPMDDWQITLYPFIAGDIRWTPPMTDEHWRSVGTTLRQIHQTRLPAGGFVGLRQETFDTTDYRHWVDVFDAQFAATPDASQLEAPLRSLWLAHQTTIHAGIATMATLADHLHAQAGPMVICHADLHPGNLIRDHAGQVWVIDWEDVMLAPKERDFLFIEDAPVVAAIVPGDAPFFQGYGPVAIDWLALTYYLWERAVQDLIVSAQIVSQRDDVGTATKADELRVFRNTLAEGGTVAHARAAAAHLPSDLGLPTQDR